MRKITIFVFIALAIVVIFGYKLLTTHSTNTSSESNEDINFDEDGNMVLTEEQKKEVQQYFNVTPAPQNTADVSSYSNNYYTSQPKDDIDYDNLKPSEGNQTEEQGDLPPKETLSPNEIEEINREYGDGEVYEDPGDDPNFVPVPDEYDPLPDGETGAP